MFDPMGRRRGALRGGGYRASIEELRSLNRAEKHMLIKMGHGNQRAREEFIIQRAAMPAAARAALQRQADMQNWNMLTNFQRKQLMQWPEPKRSQMASELAMQHWRGTSGAPSP